MKKNTITFLFAAITLLSCQKKSCFKCIVISTINTYDYNHSISSDTSHQELCDKTQDEINQYIQQQSTTRPTVHGGFIHQMAQCK